MGLDMYLKAEKYVSSVYGRDGEATEYAALVKAIGLPDGWKFEPSPGGIVSLNVAYWRKANAIHAWFVRNVQGGIDECQNADVPREKLAELIEVCQRVIEEPKLATKLLPPQAGFFFGSTEVDDSYRHDLQDTITQLKSVLTNPAFEYCDFVYHSSW